MRGNKNILRTALFKNGIKLKEESLEKLQKYLSLLEKWNEVHSLTSVFKRDIPYVFAVEPLLFAKEVSNFIQPKRCMDIGTGFGNPGVAVSLYFEDCDFFLVDASKKKTALLRSALDMGEFERLNVLTSRVEELQEFHDYFDLVISRGVGSVQKVTSYALNVVKEGGLIAILKAKFDMEEISQISGELKLESVRTLNVLYPMKNVRRYAVIYRVISKKGKDEQA